MSQGKLYVVATPIGNMEDITYRAIDVLKNVNIILSEDTRETKKLLDRYIISTQQLSYRDQNHKKMLPKILSLLEGGCDLALVSDSGTPLISDPGFKLVAVLKQNGYKVIPIPGPSAITTSLSVSGLPTDKFIFLGFLPKSKIQQEKLLKKYKDVDATLVIYESPNRIHKLLDTVNKVLGNRYMCVARELTKLYEQVLTGYNEKLRAQQFPKKGEFVVLIAKHSYKPDDKS